MVHALQEIWRVLRPNHYLIDLRPLPGETSIDVIAGDQCWRAGLSDEAVKMPNGRAADRALIQMVHEAWFGQEARIVFDYPIYLNNPDDLQTYTQTKWTKSKLPDAVLAKTRHLVANSQCATKVRIRRRVQIARYRKQGS